MVKESDAIRVRDDLFHQFYSTKIILVKLKWTVVIGKSLIFFFHTKLKLIVFCLRFSFSLQTPEFLYPKFDQKCEEFRKSLEWTDSYVPPIEHTCSICPAANDVYAWEKISEQNSFFLNALHEVFLYEEYGSLSSLETSSNYFEEYEAWEENEEEERDEKDVGNMGMHTLSLEETNPYDTFLVGSSEEW